MELLCDLAVAFCCILSDCDERFFLAELIRKQTNIVNNNQTVTSSFLKSEKKNCLVSLFMVYNPVYYLRNRKHVPCFYRVIETRVEDWENEKCYGNMSCRRVFPQLFRVPGLVENPATRTVIMRQLHLPLLSLTIINDQYVSSPYDNKHLPRRWIMKTEKLINKRIWSWLNTKFSKPKCLETYTGR